MVVRLGSILVIGLLVCVLGVGCGGSPKAPPHVTVKGNVKLDGKPMESGDVTFAVAGEVPDTIPVKSGAYEGKAKIGTARVEIRTYRPGKKNEMYPNEEPSPENYLPARYNSDSKLTAEVKQDGPNEFNFEVTKN